MTKIIGSISIMAAVALVFAFTFALPAAHADSIYYYGRTSVPGQTRALDGVNQLGSNKATNTLSGIPRGDMGPVDDTIHFGRTSVPGQSRTLDGVNQLGSNKAGNTLSALPSGDMAAWSAPHLGGTAVPGQSRALDGANQLGSDKAGNIAATGYDAW